MTDLESFYRGKRVLVTGHTGFKGSWLVAVLNEMGANVAGFALEPPTEPSLFKLTGGDALCRSYIGDINDFSALKKVFEEFKPEVVLHLAAQPIVLEGYKDPVYTFSTNVMGTVNLLECVRCVGGVKSLLNVTTDKVYKNNEWEWGYRECDELCGFDPYSNSKSCSELVTYSYKNSFFSDNKVRISTARAGNVIGGGDFAADRIIPDCVRAAIKKEKIIVRNPYSTRPYQHVLEPIFIYLLVAAAQYEDEKYAGCYNVGPDDFDCVTTGKLVELFIKHWKGAEWEIKCRENAPHEAGFLKLDNSKVKKVFGKRPIWNIDKAVEMTVRWSKVYAEGANVKEEMKRQIKEFKIAGEF